MSANSTTVDTGVIIRRSLFFLVLIILTLGNLFPLFRGLDSPQAMDQAQIAREIARGNGFTTKVIRPVAYNQAQTANKAPVPFTHFEDTYHAPLNPLLMAAVFKLIGADDVDAWAIKKGEAVFPLDRVVAAICTIFFLMAIGVNYLLISRIFDAKIAGVCALLMLFCELFWAFSLSGLPQMLMLLLFSCGLYFVYRAVEATSEGRVAIVPAMVAGVFFSLLALTHWVAVWIVLGYIIFAALAFRPRGLVGAGVLILLLLAAVGPMIRAASISGSPFGTAFLTLYGGLASGSADLVMRTHDLQAQPLLLDGLLSKVLRTTLLQAVDIIPFLGGILIAPLFFIALLHPFKRMPIANFRWAILLMWVMAALGLSVFGIDRQGLDPNQIHLLFAPIMTAYGLAFISILWSRLDIVATVPALRNAHHVAVVILCALPLLLTLPQKIRIGMDVRDRGGIPNFPPYYAPPLNATFGGIRGWTTPERIVVSDQPWAVAWYGDRVSVWLPPSREGFERLETLAADLGTPFAGIHISPSSHGSGNMKEIADAYGDFTALVMNGRVSRATASTTSPPVTIFDKDPKIKAIAERYRFPLPMVPPDMLFYSEQLPSSDRPE
jgi:hypothetical protein